MSKKPNGETNLHAPTTDADIVLTNAERWVIRQVLMQVGAFSSRAELVHYVVHKCERRGIARDRCAFLLTAFILDIAPTEELLRNYLPAH